MKVYIFFLTTLLRIAKYDCKKQLQIDLKVFFLCTFYKHMYIKHWKLLGDKEHEKQVFGARVVVVGGFFLGETNFS